MPYIYVENLEEGQEEAPVIERTEHDALQQQLEETRAQRDQAIERAEAAEKGWREAKEKYANTFLTTPARIIENHMPKKATTAQSVSELFSPKKEG